MIELAVFDIAGTTVDDHGAVYVALRSAVEEAGAPVSDADLQRWMGTDKTEAITALLRLGGIDPTPVLVAERYGRFRALLEDAYRSDPPVPLPGVPDAIAALRASRVKVALSTGFSDDVALPLLAALDWSVGPGGILDAVVTASQVPAGRPAPYMIHLAMQRTGVIDVRRTLAAGDTVVDVVAARNAGCVAVAVRTGQAADDALAAAGPDAILDSVADVPAFLADARAGVAVAS